MEGIEIEAKTIDEAIEKACREFQVPRDKLNIEIIEDGNPGFLGLGAKKARIRAALLSIDMTIEAVIPQTEYPEPAPEESAIPVPQGQRTGFRDFMAAPEPEMPEARRSPLPAAKHPPGKRRPPEHRSNASVMAPALAIPPAESPADEDEPPAKKAKRLLEGLLSRMDFTSPVTVQETGDAIVLDIQGDGSGLLIGKRGQNLDAIQYIVNKAVHHTANGQKMIVIDTEGYRRRREESLVALAMRIGEKVKKTKKPVTVGHMNAHDRRVIHMAMQHDETLTTKSRGEGEYRKILIMPSRRNPDRAEN